MMNGNAVHGKVHLKKHAQGQRYDWLFITSHVLAHQSIIYIIFLLLLIRLLMAETKGKLCRDDTVEGLIFYPNKFLTQET